MVMALAAVCGSAQLAILSRRRIRRPKITHYPVLFYHQFYYTQSKEAQPSSKLMMYQAININEKRQQQQQGAKAREKASHTHTRTHTRAHTQREMLRGEDTKHTPFW